MRWLEIRRHADTKKGADRARGSHLSAGGVALARQVGEQTGGFSLVIASNVPRTVETAIAMGFAVDDIMDMGGDVWGPAQAQLGDHQYSAWPQAFVRYAEIIAGGGPVSALAERQRELWSAVADRIADGDSALVISHGGLIEPGVVAAVRDGAYAAWGTAFGHCEGVRLAHNGTNFRLAELFRLG
jgi:broad specificity phosphatase PhoE